MSAALSFDRQLSLIDQALGIVDPAPIAYALHEDSELALPERTSITLRNGEVVTFDLFQFSDNIWSAKNADHDHQCGWGATKAKAIADLESLCNDEIEEAL